MSGVKGLVLRRRVLGYFFLIPTVTLLCTLNFYPIINSIIMSFTNWTGFTNNYKWVGIANFKHVLFNMPEYWKAMSVGVRFALISTTIQTILGFFLGVLVISLSTKLQNFYKVAIYMPVILPSAVVALLWRMIYTPDFGILNQMLRAIGLSSWTRAWTGDPNWALASVIFTNTWRYVGFTTVLYFVSFLGIDKEMIESSMMDGCSGFGRIRHFYFPLTRGTTEINYLLSLTGGLRAFDMFYLLTHGGPGTTTRVIGILVLNEGFRAFRFGRTLAMSLVLFVVVSIAAIITRLVLAPRDDY